MGSARLVRLLVAHGARVQRRAYRDSFTALHTAAQHGREGAVGALLALGALPRAEASMLLRLEGRNATVAATPLHVAVAYAQERAVLQLLRDAHPPAGQLPELAGAFFLAYYWAPGGVLSALKSHAQARGYAVQKEWRSLEHAFPGAQWG